MILAHRRPAAAAAAPPAPELPRLGPHARPRRRRSLHDQVGAALVEFAIVSMFLVVVAAGAFDYGMAWRVGLATNEAARTAARTGSGLGNDPLADWYAVSGAQAALQNSGRLQDVQRVVIYRADSANGAVPSACTTATSTTEKCIIFTGAQFRALTQASFNITTTGCPSGSKALVANWCPSSRNAVQLTAESYGVWIQTRYVPQFKMLGSGITVSREAVMRLEPEVS